MKYVDTHAHLNLPVFSEDSLEVAKKCADEKVVVINVGTGEETSVRAVKLAEQTDNCFAIVGLHPIHTVSSTHKEDKDDATVENIGEEFDKDFYRKLANSGKVVGIGECGFDYYRTRADSYEIQERNFIAQIELANELALPLMIHTRGPQPGEESPTGRSVYQDVYMVLKQYAKVPFNVHFYAGTTEEAAHFFEIGGTISFTGVITFAKAYEELVKNAPLDRIHAETDCPFVAPIPYRGQRAEPWMVQAVYKKIAFIKGVDEEVVREQLLKNAAHQYKLSL